MVLGGDAFLMSETPVYTDPVANRWRMLCSVIHLAHVGQEATGHICFQNALVVRLYSSPVQREPRGDRSFARRALQGYVTYKKTPTLLGPP